MTEVYMWITRWILWITSKKFPKNRQMFQFLSCFSFCKSNCIGTEPVNTVMSSESRTIRFQGVSRKFKHLMAINGKMSYNVTIQDEM